MKNISAVPIRTVLLFLSFIILLSACKKEEEVPTPVISLITPENPAGGDVITITGKGLEKIETIVFDNGNVPASFNPVFNTGTAILFRVPDTAFGGEQNIILTNYGGKQASVAVNVIALPTISSIFPTDFSEGSTVTINGNNLETTMRVTLVGGSGGEAAIVSAERNKLVITMPASNAAKVKLKIENSSGEREPDITLINLNEAFSIFTEGSWAMDNWSWGGVYTNSTNEAITGTESLQANMVGNSWGALSLHADPAINLSDYTEIAFWIKGGANDVTFSVMLNWSEAIDAFVPAGKWSYFKFPLQRWKSVGVNALNDLIYQVKGDGELVYFDNIVLLK